MAQEPSKIPLNLTASTEISSQKEGSSAPADLHPAAIKTRGLASFVESLFEGSKLRKAGLPTKAEEAPAEEEAPELLDLLLEGPDAMIVLSRADGEIIEVSQKFLQWTGLSREEINGHRFLDLFPEGERKAARTLYEDAGVGGVHVLELPSSHPDHSSRLLEFTSSKTLSGHGNFAVVFGRDVGERAASERYLRAERDRLNTFIRSMRDALVLVSPGGDILYCNPAADQMFESYELPIVCHRWLNEFSRQDKADLQGLTSAYEGQTLELESGDGRYFLVTRSFLFEQGKRATAMLMIKDITEQKLMQRQNYQLEVELMRETKLAEFGTLAAGIAHNLNGPLTGILGFCDLIAMTHSDIEDIKQIRDQALRMREIIANLMQKSRSEQETKQQELNIDDIIHTELTFLTANLFFKHNIDKDVELDANCPPLWGVYIDFSQVIGNLLRNAIDAMNSSEKKLLTVKTSVEGRYLKLVISDTGTGMSEETKQNLFKPFYTTKPKASQAAPGQPTGTGLGLSTSRGILARYGAEIQVDSTLGKGTTFTIRFPLGRKPSAG